MSDRGDNGPIFLNPTGASPDTPKSTLSYLLRRKTSKTLSQKGGSGFEGLYAARVMLQAKKNTPAAREGPFAAKINAVHAPSLQPTKPAFSRCIASMTATTSDAINPYEK